MILRPDPSSARSPRWLAAFGLGLWLALAPGQVVARTVAMDLCLRAIDAEERRQPGLPTGLLGSIALVESAHRPVGERRTVPWPWTINSPLGSFYLPSRSAAVAKVEALREQGVRNIDVGCMQVNLMHHPQAFRHLHDAFDPDSNVRYASRFLRSLRTSAPSLFEAVGRYHSHTPERRDAYAERVFRRWGQPIETARSRHGLGTPDETRIIESLVGRPARPTAGLGTSSPTSGRGSLSGSPTTGRLLAPRGTSPNGWGR
jgi:hypothetical protein